MARTRTDAQARRTPATARRTAAATAALAVLAGAPLAGCGPDGGGTAHDGGTAGDGARIQVAHSTTTRADEPLALRVTGLPAHTTVRLDARTRDRNGRPWTARQDARTDAHGTVRLDGAAGGRLLSDMTPDDPHTLKRAKAGRTVSFHPLPPGRERSYEVRLGVTARSGAHKGDRLASRTIARQWLPRGATHRKLTVGHDGLAGDLYLPPRDGGKSGGGESGESSPSGGKSGSAAGKAPVLVFGGSEGGNAGTYTAALLAAHGHPAMSLCYFRCGPDSGRPDAIDGIDLDYFTRAARLLAKQPGADPRKLAVMGNSRGSEIAQLLGQRRPSAVRDVIAYAPSSKVIGPYPTGTHAWSDHGRPVPTGTIPLNRVRGEVFTVAGGNDRMWGSADSASSMASRGAQRRVYPDAGHHVNWFPYGQPAQETGRDGNRVRTSVADQRARADSWPRILKLLDR
ncbi:acyl-CoA thioesterase/BAAT N-terminal domain-containing protein [Streptomyces sp. NRRL F-5053]|uniref:acyl-CoA thioesterase/BAAT N-terminal domain-containing protein n=1 Tax=Streptomyces sp. NRRL F-5053 TaxID=1463854 RepID=UPI00099D4196|nr:acyl-CoA thioester hydrolase/BAAT C-terminal domain-containing protein [Streptomyces sp. NRRL F-5053]